MIRDHQNHQVFPRLYCIKQKRIGMVWWWPYASCFACIQSIHSHIFKLFKIFKGKSKYTATHWPVVGGRTIRKKTSTACCLQIEIMALLEIEIGQMKVVGSFLDSSNCSIPGWGPVVEFSRNIGIPRRPIISGVGQETRIKAIFDLKGRRQLALD